MRAGFVWLLSFLWFPVAGWPLLAHPRFRRLSVTCRIGLATAAGLVATSASMTGFALIGLKWRPILLLPLVLLASASLRLLLRAEDAPEAKREEGPAGIREKAALGISAVSVLWAFVAAGAGAASSADLLLFWGPKAQAFAAARTIDAGFLGDFVLEYMHRSYPPLVTNTFAFASMAAGRFAWGAAVITFPLLLAVLALALPGVLRLAAPRAAAWGCSALIVSVFGFFGNQFDVAGNAEPFLWLFVTLAMALLIGPAGLTRGGQLLAGLFLAGGAAAKVEGLPYAAATAVLFLLVARKEVRLLPAILRLLLPTACCLGAWFGFGIARGLFHEYEGYGLTFQVHWERVPAVLKGLGTELWTGGFALPYLLPFAALLVAVRKSRTALVPIGVALALSLFFVFTYLHGDPDPSLWIAWSAGRTFSTLSALLALASLARAPAVPSEPTWR